MIVLSRMKTAPAPSTWLAIVGILLACLAFAQTGSGTASTAAPPSNPTSQSSSEDRPLCIVWTSGDPDVAHRMCLMYGHAAKQNGWFSDVHIVVWGPSARLLAGDKSLQQKVQDMAKDGVQVEACIVCADSYGVTQQLQDLGLTVRGMGKPLSDRVKADWHILTF